MNPKPDKQPTPPVPPADWECCGSECGEACLHEIYRRQKAEYDALRRTAGRSTADQP